MVCASTPRLGFVPEVNLARSYVHRAHAALDAGNLIEAGVLLREGLRLQLRSECHWFGCLPRGASDRTPPFVLLKALRNAGHVGDCSWQLYCDMIDACNRAAHARPVDADVLKGSISLLHAAIDNDPCGEPRERIGHCLPVADDDTDTDDDGDGDVFAKGGVR